MSKPIGQMTTGELAADVFFKGLWVKIIIDIVDLFMNWNSGSSSQRPMEAGYTGLGGEWEDPNDPVWDEISGMKACGLVPDGGWDQYRDAYEEKLKSVRLDAHIAVMTDEWPQWLRDQEGEWLIELEARSRA